MELNNLIKEKISEFCQDKENESCGFILENNKVFPAKNIHDIPSKYFKISLDEFRKAEQISRVIAVYHSHPSGKTDFSDADKIASETLKIPFVLYVNGDFFVYQPHNYQIPLVGRDFLLGSLDCLTLVIDYYREKLNIVLPDISHPYRFKFSEWESCQEENSSILVDYFKRNHFIEVHQPCKHDIILIKTPKIKYPIHCLIYLGEGKILHHPYEGKSEIRGYTSGFKKFKTHVFKRI